MGKKFWEKVKVTENIEIVAGTYCLKFHSPNIVKQAIPGNFIMLRVDDTDSPLLNRPLGIAGTDEQADIVTVYYRVVGKGTEILSNVQMNEELFVVGPLGNGFDMTAQKPLLVGGGIGLAPLLFVAQKFKVDTDIIIGARNKVETFWVDLFASYCKNIYLTTDDGSCGTKGNCATILPDINKKTAYDVVMACGPEPMLSAVSKIVSQDNVVCQLSLEKHMACGFGACLTCTCESVDGDFLQVCKHGPVFDAKDVKI